MCTSPFSDCLQSAFSLKNPSSSKLARLQTTTLCCNKGLRLASLAVTLQTKKKETARSLHPSCRAYVIGSPCFIRKCVLSKQVTFLSSTTFLHTNRSLCPPQLACVADVERQGGGEGRGERGFPIYVKRYDISRVCRYI